MSFTQFLNVRGMGDIPRAITAKTASSLERKMLQVQLRHKSFINWHTILYNPDDKLFYAFYVIDIEKDDTAIEQEKLKNQG